MRRYLYYIGVEMASFRAILSIAVAVLLISTSPLRAGEIHLPSLDGDATTSILSSEQEQLLGESFMRSLREQVTIIEHPVIHHYIQTLGERLVLHSDTPSNKYTFLVVDNPSINAFAGPAGIIGVHSGLIEMAEHEGELAAVLAHEIAHVSQRHLMRRLESQQDLSIPTIATVLATIVAASASPEAGEAVAATATGLSLQQQINFTRSNEQEADRIGMKILHQAGYAPSNMPEFFRKLQKRSRSSGDSLPEYLRTHPLTLSRVADAESRAAQYPPQETTEDETFQLIRHALRLNRFNNPPVAVRHYRKALQGMADSPFREHTQYGLGLALLQADRPTEALQQLLPLLQKWPDQPVLTIAVAYAEAEGGNPDTARERIQKLSSLYPGHLPLILAHVELLLQASRADEAVQLLERHLRQLSRSPMLYQQLATAHALANHPAESHLAQAEYHFLNGETESALRQLDYAERAAREGLHDFILFSTIDARRLAYEEKEQREKRENP